VKVPLKFPFSGLTWPATQVPESEDPQPVAMSVYVPLIVVASDPSVPDKVRVCPVFAIESSTFLLLTLPVTDPALAQLDSGMITLPTTEVFDCRRKPDCIIGFAAGLILCRVICQFPETLWPLGLGELLAPPQDVVIANNDANKTRVMAVFIFR
jgi:hypothetical protein